MHGARVGAVLIASLVAAVVVLAIAFPGIVLIRTLEANLAYGTLRTPRVLVSVAYPRLKTGDLILFAAASTSPSSALTGTFFSHAAMLFREGARVFTSESQMGTDHFPRPGGGPAALLFPGSGAVRGCLLSRLKYYVGASYLVALARPLAADREAAVRAEAARLHAARYPYPTSAEAVASVLWPRGAKGSGGARHCFQHVAHLLEVAGLAESGLADSGFIEVCRRVCTLPGRPLGGAAAGAGNAYLPPVQLLYDLDAEDAGG